jgi:hypothetical protein
VLKIVILLLRYIQYKTWEIERVERQIKMTKLEELKINHSFSKIFSIFCFINSNSLSCLIWKCGHCFCHTVLLFLIQIHYYIIKLGGALILLSFFFFIKQLCYPGLDVITDGSTKYFPKFNLPKTGYISSPVRSTGFKNTKLVKAEFLQQAFVIFACCFFFSG